jgi:hypothetical protein
MAYKEPGPYLELVNSSKFATGNTPSLVPLIMGGGASILEKTVVITRAATGEIDYLPNEAQLIIAVGNTTRKPTYFQTAGEDVKDFTHTEGDDFITWETDTENKPVAGDDYYVTYTYEVGEGQYEPKVVFTETDVENYFGPEFKEHELVGGVAPINRLSLAAKIALEAGAPAVYVLQVKPNETTGEVTAVEYQDALDKHARFLDNAWRIIPVETSADINNAIDSHVEICSSYEERKERTAIYKVPQASAPADFSEVLSVIGGYAEAKNYKRITVFYPDVASKLLSDGNTYDLDGAFIAAALAGREAFLPVYKSKTRDEIKVFSELKGVKMTRKQMNMLAEKGVTILTQPAGIGTSIVVRHQLTTEMISPQTRENSIVMIGDYVSKYLREICQPYIGKYNITGETITRIQGTLDGGFYQLIKEKVITIGGVDYMAQDEFNPDTLLVTARFKPPYPCNYIEITLFMD